MKKSNSATAKSAALQSILANIFAGVTIIICFVVGYIVWKFVMGNPLNFQDNDPVHGHPIEGSILGMIYKGGIIVPVLMGLLLMAVTFSIERFFMITRAEGKGSVGKFVKNVQKSVLSQNIDEAIELCDAQKGTVANVVKSALAKYQEVNADGLDTEKAAEMIQGEIEGATALEMPALEKNMTIISTLVSLGTLMGLFGTVSGMIKAFSGLAAAGTPDAAALANGISEALVNTATGIGTSIVSIISYNFFTAKIDTLTYFIDEAGAAITQAYRKSKSK